MQGIELKLSPNKRELTVKVEPLLLDTNVDAKTLLQMFRLSEFAGLYVDESAILVVCEAANLALEQGDMSPVQKIIAHAIDAEIEIAIAGDKMSAQLTLTSSYMGETPNVDDVFGVLKRHDIVRGISRKRIQRTIDHISNTPGGQQTTIVVAKGLPARVGQNSHVKAMLPCALDRLLIPKYNEDGKMDMRDFGDILCVQKNQVIARRMPPTKGRNGFTVSGKPIVSEPGEWKAMKLGTQVHLAENDENVVLASITGLPKVNSMMIDVDDVFISRGVNVSTGNINFTGSVIVNGDVSEKMQVVATGDVTINGFVESAHIKADGDIIITQGASGKLQNRDCEFIAGGNVYIGHAQGVSIHSRHDIIIDKQLAYSHISCAGNVTVGKVDNPMGKLFASTIVAAKCIKAGFVGAVSGSILLIDYSERYNQAIEKHEKLSEQYESLASKNADHEIKIAKINNRKPSQSLSHKMALMNQELQLERVFLNWLRINVEESKENLDLFYKTAKVIANRSLYAGVTVKLNKKQWVAKKEYAKSIVVLENKEWVYLPLV